MTKLTKSIQDCGLHDTCTEHCCYAISHLEAQRAIDEVKKACIVAVESTLSSIEGKGPPTSIVFHSAIRRAVKAIEAVE